jgi:hypothetical protein
MGYGIRKEEDGKAGLTADFVGTSYLVYLILPAKGML